MSHDRFQTLLVATTNPGKIREILPILTGTSLRILTLGDLNQAISEPEETGQSFADNARLKARYYAAASGMVTVAEDSGLAIDALGGRPGIWSARYPGETYPDKFANLYAELAPHPRPWTARYVCALAVAAPGTGALLYECEGTCEGEIWPEPRGTEGFGYDPIFFHPPYNQTFGEIDQAQKAAVAHRGVAFRMLKDWLATRPR